MEANQFSSPANERANAESVSAPVQTLIAYSRQQATADDVMRALVSHRGWLVPVELITKDLMNRGRFTVAENGQKTVEMEHGLMMVGNENRFMPNEFWVFTDKDAVSRAQTAGAILGTLAKDVAGTHLFRILDPAIPKVRVNPGAPIERSWAFSEGSANTVGKLWADVIAFEERLAEWNAGGKPDVATLLGYPAFLLFDHASGPIITLPNQGGMLNPAVAFTTPDCAEKFLSKVGAEMRATLQRTESDGKSLYARAQVMQIDGLLINPFGPGTAYAFPFGSVK